MVIVSNFKAVQNAEGEDFFMLVLTGEPELIQSERTGRSYFTARTCNIASTFSKEVCKSMIGKKLSGSIVKKECEPYEYHVPNSDETVELDYTWEYDSQARTIEETVTVDTVI